VIDSWLDRGARALRGRRGISGDAGSAKDVIGRVLRLCGSMNEKLAIIAKLLQPAGNICSLIRNDGA